MKTSAEVNRRLMIMVFEVELVDARCNCLFFAASVINNIASSTISVQNLKDIMIKSRPIRLSLIRS